MKQALVFPVKENFNFYFEPSSFEVNPDIKKIIKENWDANIKTNSNLFNGEVICLKQIIKKGNAVNFIFNKTDYAHFLASYQNKIPKTAQCRNLHTSVLIETEDNFVVFARMGKNSFDSDRYQFIGGGLEFKFIKNETIDFTACAKTELLEEINIDTDDTNTVANFKKHFLCIGKNKGSFSVLYLLKLKIDSLQLKTKLKLHNDKILKQNKGVEAAELIFVNKEDYKEKLFSLKDKTLDVNLFSSVSSYFTYTFDDETLIN